MNESPEGTVQIDSQIIHGDAEFSNLPASDNKLQDLTPITTHEPESNSVLIHQSPEEQQTVQAIAPNKWQQFDDDQDDEEV
jgi:hypothetical protein